MRTTLEALLRSLTRPRPLAVAIISGAAYAGAVIGLPHWEPVQGLPGMRPALALLAVLAVLGGAPAAAGGLLGGIAVGLVGAGAVGKGAVPALAEGLAGLLLGLVSWKAGWLIRARSEPGEDEVRPRLAEVLWDLFLASVFASLAYASFLAWAGEALQVHPYPYTAITEGANALLALVVLSPPLFLILHPIARGAGVVWVDPRGDATKAGWARAGRALVWAGVLACAVVGFVAYHAVAAHLTTLANPAVLLPWPWLAQLPLVVVTWWGALTG